MCFFFFQAEDGIRDGHVTGVQTCALPILAVVSGNSRRTGGYSPSTRVEVVRRPPDSNPIRLPSASSDRAMSTLPPVDRERATSCRVRPRTSARSEERRGGKGWRGAGEEGRGSSKSETR